MSEYLLSSHDVHRGSESIPCYCAATKDHQIGEEVARKKRTIRDARMEMSHIDYRLLAMAIMKCDTPEHKEEIAQLENRLKELEAEYPGRLRQTPPEFRPKK